MITSALTNFTSVSPSVCAAGIGINATAQSFVLFLCLHRKDAMPQSPVLKNFAS